MTVSRPTALVLHGGAGVIERADLSADTERGIREALAHARDAGEAVLRNGGSALDAVQAVVVSLEESPHFNAGKGSEFDADGKHELDASIMDGATLRAGASRFADTFDDIQRVANDWYDTPHRLQQLREEQVRERAAAEGEANNLKGKYFGTVGAVALDANGHIAAATSTGGMTNKRWGRVGDTPVIGGGTYADARCGVSATGWGEFFLRLAVAHDICARVAYRGDSLRQAADDVILRELPALGGDGGAIAIDREGNIAMPFNTSGMYRAWVKPDGSRGVAIFGDEG